MTDRKPGMLISKKKKQGPHRLGVQPGTIDKVAAQVAAAETTDTEEYEVRYVALANIQLWEDQPRTFHLTLADIYRGRIEPEDEYAKEKQDELESITGLAMSIKEFGMLNAPLAYALPGKAVQLMGGQRRTMASIFALFHIRTTMGKDDVPRHNVEICEEPDLSRLESERIELKVFIRKPEEIKQQRIGMADNVQRTELPIADKLRWVMRFADMVESRGRQIDWRDLVDTLGLNRSQAYQWVNIVKARDDVWVRKIIEKVLKAETPLNKLTEIATAEPVHREAMYRMWFDKRPTSDNKPRVSLGVTSNLSALRSLVLNNVEETHQHQFDQIDWTKPKEVKKAFAAFLKYWEETHG